MKDWLTYPNNEEEPNLSTQNEITPSYSFYLQCFLGVATAALMAISLFLLATSSTSPSLAAAALTTSAIGATSVACPPLLGFLLIAGGISFLGVLCGCFQSCSRSVPTAHVHPSGYSNVSTPSYCTSTTYTHTHYGHPSKTKSYSHPHHRHHQDQNYHSSNPSRTHVHPSSRNTIFFRAPHSNQCEQTRIQAPTHR